MLSRILILFLLFFSFLSANLIKIDKNDSKVSILEHATMYIDTTSSLKFKEIRKKKFIPTNTNYLRLGYTPDTLWLKFAIKNNSNKKLERYITLTNPMIDIIELYTIRKDLSYKQEKEGLLQKKFDIKNILHANFKIRLNANETKNFYYKTHSISSANFFQLYLKDKNKFYEDESANQIIISLFIGAMIAFIIYNLFIYYFTKEKTYLYYVVYIFFITWNHISYSSMSNYFITKDYIGIEAFAAMYYIPFANIFSILFIKAILEIKQYKTINLILNLFIGLNILLIVISLFDNTIIEYISLTVLINMFFLLYICFYSFIKKNKNSKYILMGWTFNVIGVVMLYLVNASTWSLIDNFPYFYEVTVFLEAVLFSIALASKLNKTKELEQSVAKNEILTRELHHRVKNNMQFIILMYRLKLANLTTNEVDEKLRETEGAIQAMSKTHEILYNQENLETIDTKLYFENLIDELKRSFDTKNIKINLDIYTTLDTQQAIYCGIILNELITNSFKYAFTKNKGEINIQLTDLDEKHQFVIRDNGVGFDYDKVSEDSFGLSFINAIVKDELKGKVEFKRDKGTKVFIVF